MRAAWRDLGAAEAGAVWFPCYRPREGRLWPPEVCGALGLPGPSCLETWGHGLSPLGGEGKNLLCSVCFFFPPPPEMVLIGIPGWSQTLGDPPACLLHAWGYTWLGDLSSESSAESVLNKNCRPSLER